MCDQTEIRYLDGDIVWVKLGPCWWPGQVVGVENLPDDLKVDYNKKPPIAAVKFFQENTYEFVKNIHQIYKYNCTQKDDFIKKGLDKHRSKRRDGSTLMDKFPGDVETAETLTGGDPSILKSEKFSPPEKLDISSLFGEKKLPKKKRKGKDNEMTRRSYGNQEPKIIQPRFIKERDHEVRIRHQPSSNPTTPISSATPMFSCTLCNFKTTRVNVLICHTKIHRDGAMDTPSPRPIITTPKRRSLGSNETQKRKYVRKNKSLPRMKNDRMNESVKRKHPKQLEKVTKKKKEEPEINQLLADWDDGSDDDMNVDMNKSTDSSLGSPSTKDSRKNTIDEEDDTDIIKASEILLKETESLSGHLDNSKKSLGTDSEEETISVPKKKSALSKKLKKSLENRKNSTPENDQDKKSKFSCFDFEEEEPEPAIPPVRKIPRVFGEKNTSLKKELIKEFLGQANEKKSTPEDDVKVPEVSKETDKLLDDDDDDDDDKFTKEVMQTVDEASELVAKIASETERSNEGKSKKDFTETQLEIVEILEVEREKESSPEVPDVESEAGEGEKMEISPVESISTIDHYKSPVDSPIKSPVNSPVQSPNNSPVKSPMNSPVKSPGKSPAKSPIHSPKKITPSSPIRSEVLPKDSKDLDDSKMEEIDSGRVTIETEEETLTITQLTGTGTGGEMGWSQLNEIIGGEKSSEVEESSPVDETVCKIEEKSSKIDEESLMIDEKSKNEEKPTKRRGRPRKYPLQTDISGNGDSLTKFEEPQLPGTPDSHETDRKTSESEGERSYSGRRRKPNKKYLESEFYSSSPGRRTPRTDDSQSETEEKPNKEAKKGRRGRKPSAISKTLRKSLEEYEFSDQTVDSAEEAGSSTPTPKSPVKSSEFLSVRAEALSPVNITDLLATSNVEIRGSPSAPSFSMETEDQVDKIVDTVKSPGIVEKIENEEERKIEMLPPKKSQIKKFELSQIDSMSSVDSVDSEVIKHDEDKGKPDKLSSEVDSVEELKEELSKIHEKLEDISKVITTVIQMESTSAEKTIDNVVVNEGIDTKEEERVIEASSSQEDLKNDLPQEEVQTEAVEQVIEEIIEPLRIELPEKVETIHPTLKIEEKFISGVTEPVPEVSTPEVSNDSQVLSSHDSDSASPAAPKSPNCTSPAPKSSQHVQDVKVPVKKREKPRIIENVTLREPMQILKSKLMEKQPVKGTKHKLEAENSGKNESPRPKVMKIESPVNKSNSSPKTSQCQLSIPKKLQVLKAGETLELQQEKINLSNTISITSGTSNPSEMEFDINSIPFVLSEDLNPDSIEQMPVMISPIIPSSSTITTSLTLTPSTQITTNQVQLKPTLPPAETGTSEKTPSKKKTASPGILKAKTKAKPTITSIKTLVPPLTGGVKGLKFQGQQGTKTMPVISTAKASSGKYVIVQAGNGGQQVRYTVQGTTAIPQKMGITAGKTGTSPQIVSQGGKVVILTSPQSGQTKVMPLGIQKTVTTGKVQKIMTSKGQLLGQVGTKIATIAPKSDTNSPTTSKMTTTSQKIINTGVLTSKGVFTPISGGKTIIGTIPHHFVNKSGVITQINASQLAGKTSMGQKAFLANKGTYYTPISTQGGTKTIFAPIPQSSLAGKTIIQSPGLVPGKGTVLTPFTGQQVKAMAAKSPAKGAKVQYQSVQQKVQIPMLQKKVSMTSASTIQRVGGTKSTGTIILQNPPPLHQTSPQTGKMTPKKIVRQTVMSPLSPQPGKSQSSPQLQRSKSMTAAGTSQKLRTPKQKIVVQKVSQEISSPKSTTTETPGLKTTPGGQKTTAVVTSPAPAAAGGSNKVVRGQSAVKNMQKQLSAPALSTTPAVPSPVASESSIEDKKSVAEVPKSEVKTTDTLTSTVSSGDSSKAEDQKISPPQTQIMALPTESADGSQTYVLVTIDEQGQIQPLDNNALMSLEGTTANADGSRTLYIDPSSLDPSGTIDNIVLQFDNSVASTPATEVPQTATEGFQTSNQDILAAALANTDFQQEILPETSSVISTGISQTNLDTQTILQSTLIPSTEPISSPSVLETSLTLNQPIMTPLEVPSSVGIQQNVIPAPPVSSMSPLDIPISINSNISYISNAEGIPGNSMPDIGELMGSGETGEITRETGGQFLVIPELEGSGTTESPACTISYAVSIPDNVILESGSVQTTSSMPIIQTTPSMPIIDDSFVENVEFSSAPVVQEQVQEKNEEEGGAEEDKIIRDMPIVQEDVTDAPDKLKIDEDSEKITSVPESSGATPDVQATSSEDTKPTEETQSAMTPQLIEESVEIPEESSRIQHDHEPMETDETPQDVPQVQEIEQLAQSSTQPEPMDVDLDKSEVNLGEGSQDTIDAVDESPSQSFEKFDTLSINDEVISQSTSKSEGTEASEATQSIPYGSMETPAAVEPPTQSFEDARGGSVVSVSQSSYESSNENTNAPTQSFNEVVGSQSHGEERRTHGVGEEAGDDPSFPTQSYEVGNADNLVESLETDGEISQEGNIPSQSNDIGNEEIGTSSFSNNSGINEDETASSSYVPETPENQERDQDQESAISTSSYEIPPCEDINIASSSVIADTSGDDNGGHDNGVPEIPTSSYNLNPDSSSTHGDAPTSSFEDQGIGGQSVSTSYEVPISMPRLEEGAQNFVSESTDQRNEPTSYYTRNPEEVTSAPSQSYFMPEDPTPSYTNQTVSPSCYDPPPEAESSESYYSPQEMDRTDQSSRNVEASQSFYQETTDEVRLRSQGEATPTYTERYPLDYTLDNSPIERHDLVESSVPATKPTER